MSEEQRIVIKNETFNDTAVKELAKVQAKLTLMLQFKRITEKQMIRTRAYKMLCNCKKNMSDYDLLRLQNYTNVFYNTFSSDPMLYMGHRHFVRSWIKFMLLCVLFIVLMILPFALVAQSNLYYKVMDLFDLCVIEVVEEAQKTVYDLNKDGNIDCIDYSLNFKLVWDKRFPNWKSRCDLVRNYNPVNGFNHLFVSLYTFNDNIIFIEPQSKVFPYRLEDFWGDRYDRSYNNLFELDIWIKEVK